MAGASLLAQKQRGHPRKQMASLFYFRCPTSVLRWGATGSGRFMLLEPVAKGIVHPTLPALAGGLEGGQDVVVETDSG